MEVTAAPQGTGGVVLLNPHQKEPSPALCPSEVNETPTLRAVKALLRGIQSPHRRDQKRDGSNVTLLSLHS